MDDYYEEFIVYKVPAELNSNTSVDLDLLLEEATLILKPHAEALIAYINATTDYAQIELDYYSRHFKNIVPITENYFYRSYHSSNKMLEQGEEFHLHESIKDAIRSDLKRRFLELKSGEESE